MCECVVEKLYNEKSVLKPKKKLTPTIKLYEITELDVCVKLVDEIAALMKEF